jgi:predicted AlkP superfamily pyrophosphatase or phosphodiesterase
MNPLRRALALLLVASFLVIPASPTVHNARPKLVVVIVIDQFRADYLERFRDEFRPDGFRLLMDRGAYFTDCYYDYANTHTAPGHATLGTGAYTNGHGIIGNEWYDPQRKKVVTSVEDDESKPVGAGKWGASPRNLMATTLGDELKMATGGKSKVFGVALKSRSAILPSGSSADAAFWINESDGLWMTSTYYRPDGTLPAWATKFNNDKHADSYLNQKSTDFKNPSKVYRTTAPGQKDSDGLSTLDYYETVGRTPFGNAYTFEFARELITSEQLGKHETTDLLNISLSAFDILGHQVGPDSDEQHSMTLKLDQQMAEFFGFLGRQIGMANVWIVLSADHGISPMPEHSRDLRMYGQRFDYSKTVADLNAEFTSRYPRIKERPAGEDHQFVKTIKWPTIYLSADTFTYAGVNEAMAEREVAEALTKIFNTQMGDSPDKPLSAQRMLRGFYTRSQLEAGLPNTDSDLIARLHAHSYSPLGGWYAMMIPPPFVVASSSPRYKSNTDHSTPWGYDRHVPMAFYGLPFQPGAYRQHSEPVDIVATLASLLGVNRPSAAVGRVLTEALADPQVEGKAVAARASAAAAAGEKK